MLFRSFTERLFGGNPAAVVLLDEWLPDHVLSSIAAENNLAETAFVLPHAAVTPLRWFTPTVEVDLCGHATLAAAHVLFHHVIPAETSITFGTRSGELVVTRAGAQLSMNFPARPGTPVTATNQIADAIGVRPREAVLARDLVAVLESEAQVREFMPDMQRIAALNRSYRERFGFRSALDQETSARLGRTFGRRNLAHFGSGRRIQTARGRRCGNG